MHTLTDLLNDTALMADRGRLAIIDERLAIVLAALRDECRILRDTFSACAELSASTWLQMDTETVTLDRVRKLHRLHAERSTLHQQREELARQVLPRTHLT